MIAYPSFDDYSTAVSAPARFFSDSEMQRRRVALDSLGMPVYFSGRYAFTFRLESPVGGSPIAVRCFQQEISSLVSRYREIETFLVRLDSPFFVSFRLVAPSEAEPCAGVLVKGRWLPVMRMDWVEGLTLGQYIRQHLHAPEMLERVRSSLLAYARLAGEQGFSHGDIHPDNIIVCNDELKFIDYDGMFVPGLRALGGEVAGQADFQSPVRMRERGVFNQHLDRFPLLVLDLTLAALREQPGLLDRATPGEGILLGKADFEAPGSSKTLKEIGQLPRFETAARVFADACDKPLEEVPTLDSFRAALDKAGPAPVAMRRPRWPVRPVSLPTSALIGASLVFLATPRDVLFRHASEPPRHAQAKPPPRTPPLHPVTYKLPQPRWPLNGVRPAGAVMVVVTPQEVRIATASYWLESGDRVLVPGVRLDPKLGSRVEVDIAGAGRSLVPADSLLSVREWSRKTAPPVIGQLETIAADGMATVSGRKVALLGIRDVDLSRLPAALRWLRAHQPGVVSCEQTPNARGSSCYTPGGIDLGAFLVMNGLAAAGADAPRRYGDHQG
nr:hypothetical protein [uncultured Rhodopila sp.]